MSDRIAPVIELANDGTAWRFKLQTPRLFILSCLVIGIPVLTATGLATWHVAAFEMSRKASLTPSFAEMGGAIDTGIQAAFQMDVPNAPGFCQFMGGEPGGRAGCIVMTRSAIRVAAFHLGFKARACVTQGRSWRIFLGTNRFEDLDPSTLDACGSLLHEKDPRTRLCRFLLEQQQYIDKNCH